MKGIWKIASFAAAVVLIVMVAVFSQSGEVSAKYVSESKPITFGFNVLAFGDAFNKAITEHYTGTTKVVFDYASRHPDLWAQPSVNVDCEGAGTIRAYQSGSTVYVLSEDVIYAHPWSTRLFACSNAATDNKDDSSFYTGFTNTTNFVFNNFNTSFMVYSAGMFQGSEIPEFKHPEWDVRNLKNTSNMFTNCKKMTAVDVNWTNTRTLHSVQEMFWACDHLQSVNLSNWNVSTVNLTEGGTSWQFYGMFWGCSALRSANLSNWSFTNATDTVNFGQMFKGCRSLQSIDLSSWKNTGNFKWTWEMFNGCSSLTSVNLNGWDTGNLSDAAMMFNGCSDLTSVSMNGWDTHSLKAVTNMFRGCSSLASLSAVTSWDTSSIGSFESMFENCSSLRSLDLSNWKINCQEDGRVVIGFDWNENGKHVVEYAHDLRNMFKNCSSLETLNVSGWDVSNVDYADGMLSGCSSLTTIFASANADWSGISNSSNMFAGCTSLSGDYTAFDTTNVNALYARADDPASGKPGYFTAGIAQPTPLAGQMALWATQSIVDDQQMITLTYDAAAIPEGYAFAGWYVDKGKGTELCSEESTHQFVLTEENKDWKWTIGLKKATEGGGQ